MTDTPENGPVIPTVQPIVELFTGGAQALWATTYTMDLGLFNEFLLARLGEPPLNIAVLADHRRLTTSLARIPAERADTLATVNRRWLLRGVRISGAFHPKSYLAVTSDRATLLVGSGNLSAAWSGRWPRGVHHLPVGHPGRRRHHRRVAIVDAAPRRHSR